jgi:mannose-6-phosphate isomerase-like protein (cupin superfamily)
MAIIDDYALEPMIGDPDHHRPHTQWAALTDPAGIVDTLAAIVEDIAPGDKIPLHVHPIDELVLYRNGQVSVILGSDRRQVGEDGVAFISAGMAHSTENHGTKPVSIFEVYPSICVGIEYRERNPAPGTEDHDPREPVTYDFRTGSVVPSDGG